MLSIWQIVLLALVQGLAELLPVSSSAHVIVAEKLMGLKASDPRMVVFLLMLHTGTMFAVILYFWQTWKKTYFASRQSMWRYGVLLAIATAATGVIGYGLKVGIEKVAMRGQGKAEVEMLFDNTLLISIALAAAGVVILYAGLKKRRRNNAEVFLGLVESAGIGAMQGLCLPFRGFSRSGATISTGMVMGVSKPVAEAFSFALAVILTPVAMGMEVHRMLKSEQAADLHQPGALVHLFLPGLLGLVCSFLAGLLALKWLSSWLERGRWHLFGIYCLFAAAGVLVLHFLGY